MKSSLLGLGISVTVIPAISMFAFIALMGSDIVKTANAEFRGAALESARQSTIDIRQMCDVIEISDDVAVDAARGIIFEALGKLGEISMSDASESFTAFPQNMPDSKQQMFSPLIKFGDREFTPDSTDNKLSRLLFALKERLFCDISVFSRIPKSDIFIRMASTLAYSDGQSMAGSYVSLKEGGGVSVLLGELMSSKSGAPGLVAYNKIPYSENCFPIFDETNEVIGVVSFGSPLPAVGELEKYLQTTSIGETGTLWVVDDSNRAEPVLRVARDVSVAGTKISEDPLDTRRVFLQQIVEKSRALRTGEIGVEIIKIPTKDKRRDIVRLVTYTYYKPWNWIIGTSLDADEFSGSETALLTQIKNFSNTIVYAGVIFTTLAVGLCWLLASQMSKPLILLRRVARYHSQGDMASAENALSLYYDKGGSNIREFDSLMHAISKMTRSLSDLIKSIRDDGEYVADGVAKISSLAQSLESISVSEVASMRRVAISGKSISLAADTINKAARSSASQVEKTLDISRAGGDNLQLLKRNYDALYAASENVMERLAVINVNAEKITGVVTTIAEINKQTNLLSLNASIEAEKAGEVGLGFAVVARQIRRLADKTSKAATEIENAVRQMQSAVNSGVMEMDRFGASMRQSLKIILETADSLARVIADIEGIGPKFENIAGRIAGMSDSARRIGETMLELSSNSASARDTVVEFKSATYNLGSTSVSLIEEVSRFKTAEKGDSK